MRSYILTPIAIQDLEEIHDYISANSPSAALKLLEDLFKAMDKLAKFPEMGHYRTDITDRPVRFWPMRSRYLIIYSNANPIQIVRVLSSYRDIANLLL